jgi:cytochrome c biogenesis protein CcdA
VAGSLLKDLPILSAVPWLVYYNFLFVLPMFIITLLVYFSFTSIDKASEFRERNIKKLHLVAGLLLILVGAIMLSSFLL